MFISIWRSGVQAPPAPLSRARLVELAHASKQGEDATDSSSAGTITAGAYREDCEDPVFHYGDVIGPLDNAYFSASHFWNADAGDRSTIEICDIGCGNYQNAYQKSLRYLLPGVHGRWTAKLTWPAGLSHFYLQAGGTGSIFHYGMIGFEYDGLVQFYRDGRCTITGYLDVNGQWITAATLPDRLLKIITENVGTGSPGVIGRITPLGDMGVPARPQRSIPLLVEQRTGGHLRRK